MVGYFFKPNASNSKLRIEKLEGEKQMATLIRPEISTSNKYWIDKHRHYELKHFCLQYPNWKRAYADLDNPSIGSSAAEKMPTSNVPGDPTGNSAVKRAFYSRRIKMVERAAREADDVLWEYILKAVTEELSYTHLKSKFDIPCGKDMYYDRYRRFFWLLSESRD
jgi:hypothetical protein